MARSSSGLGRRPLKAEISSSNLLRATKRSQVIGYAGGLFSCVEARGGGRRWRLRRSPGDASCKNARLGEKMAPEQRLCTQLLPKRASWRQNDAEPPVSCGIAAQIFLRAPRASGTATAAGAAATSTRTRRSLRILHALWEWQQAHPLLSRAASPEAPPQRLPSRPRPRQREWGSPRQRAPAAPSSSRTPRP